MSTSEKQHKIICQEIWVDKHQSMDDVHTIMYVFMHRFARQVVAADKNCRAQLPTSVAIKDCQRHQHCNRTVRVIIEVDDQPVQIGVATSDFNPGAADDPCAMAFNTEADTSKTGIVVWCSYKTSDLQQAVVMRLVEHFDSNLALIIGGRMQWRWLNQLIERLRLWLPLEASRCPRPSSSGRHRLAAPRD